MPSAAAPPEPGPDDIPRGHAALRPGLLVLLGLAWPVVPVLLAGAAFMSALSFAGVPPTADQARTAARFSDLALAGAVAIPALGLGVALLAPRPPRGGRGAVRFFATATALSVAVVVAALTWPSTHHDDPAAPPRPVGCQEYSGGASECPGG